MVLEDNILWNNIQIHRIESQNGSGEALKMMGEISGFVLTAKNLPTLYVVEDAIWTEDIKKKYQKI